MNKVFTQLVEQRGLDYDFLHPDYNKLKDPFILPGMREAVDRIKQAIVSQDKILIYGDYDADGVTASTVMEETLKLAGAKPGNISIMLPDRFADGYGMSPRLITRAKEQGINLVITVDCGSRNHDIVNELNALNINSIITDHHETDDALPEAVAVINPKRKDAPTESLYNLAGVGVAFKLTGALVKEQIIKPGQEKWLLDLVLIGTICDSMLLTGENRILGFYGMKVLAKTRRPGLKELMLRAKIKNLNTNSIGFQIGPRINAAGRLETADLSLNLLRADSPVAAAPLAEKLETLNKKRRLEQTKAIAEIESRGLPGTPVIIETGDWHEGILGIIAGRLVEEHHKPAFVLADVGNNIYKGSGRSFGDFNLAEALNFAKDAIISGGGHAGAAGVRLEQKNLYGFREKINEYYRSLHLENQEKYFHTRADLAISDFSDLNLELLKDLKSLEPYGPGNEEPVFRLENVKIINKTRLGAEGNHLRLDLVDKNGKTLKLIAFFAPEAWLDLDTETKIEPLIKFIENDFNGVKSIEARIVDILCYN